MAALCKNFTVFLSKHPLNSSLLNLYGVHQVRHAGGGFRNPLTIYPKATNKSKKKKNEEKEMAKNEDVDEKLLKDIMESEFSEKMIHLFENDLKVKEKLKRDTMINREILKMQIIKRKYFKHEKEDNVLTWRAKEQIRYLHEIYPEDWSIKSLAGTFPVSVYGVSKIVKSNFIEVSKKAIEKHDSKVLEKWREWSESDIQDERLSRIMYAAGIPDLPFRRTPTRQKFHQSTPFSDFYKQCVQHDTLLESEEKIEKREKTVNDQDVLAFYQKILDDLFSKNESRKTLEKENVTQKYHDSKQTLEKDVYQKNKTVYDEDGEFLFRIP